MDGTVCLSTSKLYVGKQGVAFDTLLSPEQQEWYNMNDCCAPYITMLIGADYHAKDLGNMFKTANLATDWQQSTIPKVQSSKILEMYSIYVIMTTSSTLKHLVIHRSHVREKMDHQDANAMLHSRPVCGLTDVGFCSTAQPVTFTMTSSTPVWIPQYHT